MPRRALPRSGCIGPPLAGLRLLAPVLAAVAGLAAVCGRSVLRSLIPPGSRIGRRTRPACLGRVRVPGRAGQRPDAWRQDDFRGLAQRVGLARTGPARLVRNAAAGISEHADPSARPAWPAPRRRHEQDGGAGQERPDGDPAGCAATRSRYQAGSDTRPDDLSGSRSKPGAHEIALSSLVLFTGFSLASSRPVGAVCCLA